MKIIKTINEMKDFSALASLKGRVMGFVPTMGYLHEGHLSLIRAARAECGTVIMSIFVNPAQFGPGEDLEKYPRDMERDLRLAEKAGTDVLFCPSAEEMYPSGYSTYVEVTGNVSGTLCGFSRPGHFKGVATVVLKLFNIVRPNISYFGQKDAQQAVIIKKMAKDLNVPVGIRVMPIVRETDGLAMSSRNSYLSKEERLRSRAVYRSLKAAEEMVKRGRTRAADIKKEIEKILSEENIRVDYIGIVDAETLEDVDTAADGTLISVAVFAGKTRLIDNVVIEKGGVC
ncbi:MAG: pantoate--beta-alanine ligase [Candidatus Omnitrophota bacterium]